MNPSKTFGPYSPLRQAGDLFFTAGQVGVDTASGNAEPDISRQTTQALANLAGVLQTVGLNLNDVVKTTIYVTNMGDFAAVNEVYVTHFAEPRPARSTVAVAELPRVAKNGVPLRVEIEAVAMRAPR